MADEGPRATLRRAADLADDAAWGVLIHSNLRRWAAPDLKQYLVGLRQSQCDLIAASGPEHWQAVAAVLREAAGAFFAPGPATVGLAERTIADLGPAP